MKIIHLCQTKIKLTSLGMDTTREKDHFAGFDFVMKDGIKLKIILNLLTQETLHMTVCYMTKNSYIEIFQHKTGVEEIYWWKFNQAKTSIPQPGFLTLTLFNKVLVTCIRCYVYDMKIDVQKNFIFKSSQTEGWIAS